MDNIRVMPTTMVASIMLLYRRGIAKKELEQKVDWLGMILNDRGANFANDLGLPGKHTLQIGLEQLDSYVTNKAGIYEPKLIKGDYQNYIMLMYYRNPLNQVFFNEAIVLVSMHSFGLEQEWQQGIDLSQLFERSCFISDLLKKEEFVKKRINKHDRDFFNSVIQFMKQKRILINAPNDPQKVVLRTSGESQIIFILSLIFPIIDSYYVVLVYILTFVKNKGIDIKSYQKNLQWLSELLFKQGSIQFFESCNQ